MDKQIVKLLRNSFLLVLFVMVSGTIGLVLTGKGLLSEQHLAFLVTLIVGVSLTLLLVNSFYYTRGSDVRFKMLRNSFLIFLLFMVSEAIGLILTGKDLLSDHHLGLLIKIIGGVSLSLLMANVFYYRRRNARPR